ncbi:ADP-ribosylation factor-like protein 13B isoform X2 [Venturia canescens]|nr:ADP-ribosylation factor-like protein 13B isoform X2 [Venturia canescens]
MGFHTVSLKHKSCFIKVYDIGGASQIRSIWPKYYNDVHGLIYVVDASDISRLTENKIVFGELIAHEHISGKPILLLANKQDISGALDELDIVENMEVERLANTMRCPTRVETCSCVLSGEKLMYDTLGIINGYKWLLDMILKNFATLDHRIKHSQNGLITRVQRKLSATSMTPSRASIRSNPFKPIQELLAQSRDPNSSNENLIEPKKKRTSLKKFLAPCKNKTAPLSLGERMSKSQHSLHNAGLDVLPTNNAQENQDSMNLVTLNPTNLISLELKDRPKPRPFTAPEISRRREPLVLYNIPGQVPH